MLSLLRMRVLRVLSRQFDGQTVSGAIDAAGMSKADWAHTTLIPTAAAIPLKRTRDVTPIVYVCAIAHRLATPAQPAATIAAQLVDTMNRASSHCSETLPPGITLQATATGFIQFAVGDRAITAWLNQWLTEPPQQALRVRTMAEAQRQVMVSSAAVFEVQYTHARCCSLLRLAHREGVIRLDGLEKSPLHWRFVHPPSLPWLTAADQLCLTHPLDRSLLSHLFAAIDRLPDPSLQPSQPSQTQTQLAVLQAARAIAHAFEAFHRAHPLGSQAETEPTIVMAHLGLLMATQRILALLLSEGLHLCPIVEL